MSSVEGDSDTTRSNPRRKTRKTRACDMCRRRKVRCDGGKTASGVCTNCVYYKYKCTYFQSAEKRVPDAGYVKSLEEQLVETRALLAKYRQLYPNGDPSGLFERAASLGTDAAPTGTTNPFTTNETELSDTPHTSTSTLSSFIQPPSPLPPVPTPTLEEHEPDFDPSDDEVSTHKELIQPLERMTLYHNKNSFQGKSSSMMFIQAALDTRRELVFDGAPIPCRQLNTSITPSYGGEGEAGENGHNLEEVGDSNGKAKEKDRSLHESLTFQPKRVEYWTEHKWVLRTLDDPEPSFSFPPPDLLHHLISLYFSEINTYTPLLHQPTFERDVRAGLHLRDNRFGAVLLMVCAQGATVSVDPRVLLDEERSEHGEGSAHKKTYYSAGWMWFEQVQRTRVISLRQATLYDMQLAYLIASYAVETSMSWYCIGYGIRVAQLLGAHRKKSYEARPSVEGELRKRAFWALVLYDRTHSSMFGRPLAIQDEDFDLDLPIACDDEYWLHPDPAQAFKQPEYKPSKVVYFNCLLRLSQIHAFALRTIYSINKSKALLGLVGRDWQQRVVAQVDSALNRWLDGLPAHLRWDLPHMNNDLFFMQSANIYVAYYNLQIVVHRPFIPSPRNPSPLSSPYLAICANAARSCIHVLDEQCKRVQLIHEQHALFNTAIVLLLNIWGDKKLSASAESTKDMQEVHKVMHIAKCMESRNHGYGRIWDAISSLVAIGDRTMSERPSSGSKRPFKFRDVPADCSYSQPSPPAGEREVAGTKRVQQFQQQQQQTQAHRAQPLSSPSQILHTNEDSELSTIPLRTFGDCPQNSINSSSGVSQSFDTTSNTHEPFITPSSFGPLPTEDSMMQPPINPVLEALLSMLSPAQYQQAEMASTSLTVLHNTGSIDNDTLWTDVMSGLNTDGAIHPDTVDFGSVDPSIAWSSAPGGFVLEDWETYLMDLHNLGDGASGASGLEYQ
ncbi:fungal-specific transcription factor domain-containing protein [Cytidiella melzeri]|nr:fungal-specific transcription factor domain-containing protein [Cytidiella melzeri]